MNVSNLSNACNESEAEKGLSYKTPSLSTYESLESVEEVIKRIRVFFSSLSDSIFMDTNNREKESILADLEQLERKHSTPKEIGEKLFKIVNFLRHTSQYEIGEKICDLGIHFSKILINESLLSKFYYQKAWILQSFGKYMNSIEISEISFSIAQKIGYKIGIAQSLRNIGWCWLRKGEYDKAKKYFNVCLEIADKNDLKLMIAKSQNNLGSLYLLTRNYSLSLEYYEKSLELKRQLGNKGVSYLLGNIGSVLFKQGKYSKSLEYLEKSLAMKRELGNKHAEAANLGNIGLVYHKRKEYLEAMKYYEKSLGMNRQLGNKHEEANTLGCIALVMKALGNHKESIEYFEKTINLYQTIGLGDPKHFQEIMNEVQKSIETDAYLSISKNIKGRTFESFIVEKKIENDDENDDGKESIIMLKCHQLGFEETAPLTMKIYFHKIDSMILTNEYFREEGDIISENRLPKHPNIMSVIHSFTETLDQDKFVEEKLDERFLQQSRILIMPTTEQNLERFLSDRKKSEEILSEYKVLSLMRGILSGINHLKKHGVVHLNLKEENIFLTEKNQVLIGGFGKHIDLKKKFDPHQVSFPERSASEGSSNKEGTSRCSNYHLSPEVLDKKPNDTVIDYSKIDVFSAGLIFHGLLTLGKEKPFRCVHGRKDVLYSPIRSNIYSDEVKEVVHRMCCCSIDKRITGEEAVQTVENLLGELEFFEGRFYNG